MYLRTNVRNGNLLAYLRGRYRTKFALRTLASAQLYKFCILDVNLVRSYNLRQAQQSNEVVGGETEPQLQQSRKRSNYYYILDFALPSPIPPETLDPLEIAAAREPWLELLLHVSGREEEVRRDQEEGARTRTPASQLGTEVVSRGVGCIVTPFEDNTCGGKLGFVFLCSALSYCSGCPMHHADVTSHNTVLAAA